MEKYDQKHSIKSTFVNVVSWIFIAISGLWTFMVFVQNMVVQIAFPQKQVAQIMQNAEQSNQLPSLVRFLISNLDFVLFALLLLSFTLFVSSIGLLRRRNWARIIFILFIAFGSFCMVTGVVMQFAMFHSISEMSEEKIPDNIKSMMLVMRVASSIIALTVSLLFGFIIKKLCSREIRSEFTSQCQSLTTMAIRRK